jgi:hypothetical protein
MGERKGAFELSLGFIVMVVFAIVLLSLAILWLQGILTGVTGLTDDLTQQAQTQLQSTFAQTESNFAVWPNRYELERTHALKMSAGIKNDDISGQSRSFAINVLPSAASPSVCQQTIDTCTAPGGGKLSDYMKTWVTFPTGIFTVLVNKVGYRDISITVPANAVKGTYQFDVVACCTNCAGSTVTTSAACLTNTLNWGGSPQAVEIVVK